jgi:hypothetical protein
MIRLGVVLLAVWMFCVVPTANAADVPFLATNSSVTREKPKLKVQKPRSKQVRATKAKAAAAAPNSKQTKAVPEQANDELNLVWVLDPLSANSDGAKREDSAGVETNLVVTEPGNVLAAGTVIELSGHVVKTAQTTARIDIRIGKASRTVSWNADDVQSGRFKISFNQPISSDKLPEYFPVSALAFVTKDGKVGASMISLEKVVIRFQRSKATASKKDPATNLVTGSISAE